VLRASPRHVHCVTGQALRCREGRLTVNAPKSSAVIMNTVYTLAIIEI
jgi:hypothetical protein